MQHPRLAWLWFAVPGAFCLLAAVMAWGELQQAASVGYSRIDNGHGAPKSLDEMIREFRAERYEDFQHPAAETKAKWQATREAMIPRIHEGRDDYIRIHDLTVAAHRESAFRWLIFAAFACAASPLLRWLWPRAARSVNRLSDASQARAAEAAGREVNPYRTIAVLKSEDGKKITRDGALIRLAISVGGLIGLVLSLFSAAQSGFALVLVFVFGPSIALLFISLGQLTRISRHQAELDEQADRQWASSRAQNTAFLQARGGSAVLHAPALNPGPSRHDTPAAATAPPPDDDFRIDAPPPGAAP